MEATETASVLLLIEVPGATCPIPWGDVQEAAGERAIAYLQAAGEAALRRDIAAIVTAPVHKAAIGGSFKGQTDFLAEQAGPHASRWRSLRQHSKLFWPQCTCRFEKHSQRFQLISTWI